MRSLIPINGVEIDGRRIARATIERWWRRGVRTPNGTAAKLQTERLGGRRFTRPEYIASFISRINGDEPGSPDVGGTATSSPKPRHPGQVRRQHDRAERDL